MSLYFIDTLKILDAIKQVHLFYFILSASPQLTIVPPNLNDPATVAVGGAAAIGGGLLLNHLLGDPAGKAIGNLLEGNRNQNRRPVNRPPTNVQHHHHHYIPEYEEYQEGI